MNKFNWGIRACGIFLLWATTAIALPAQTLTTLHNFGGRDGWQPIAALVQGTDGNFYGTTSVGGVHNNCRNSCGTVFRITSDGTTTTLHSFDGTDGEYPDGGLVLGTNGKFYGTTVTGIPNGGGTVFSITAGGRLEKLSIFLSENGDGDSPFAGLIQGTDGKFYGTTESGGQIGYNAGTVFSVTAGGTLTTLATFDRTNGEDPLAGLVQGTDGDFYGTTSQGGANLCNRGGLYCGTVFKVTADGSLTTIHSFDGTDGQWPEAGLVEGPDGNFYGTTQFGGAALAGTVFKITPGGTLTTLYNFGGSYEINPYAGLVLGTDGNFYGTTISGGNSYAYGTIFRITPGGTLTTLYSFDNTDGSVPNALVQGTDGNFYGTTAGGGTGACGERHGYGCGTVFSLSVGLGPFIKTNPTSGMVGSAVTILGTDLTNVTNVRFNGIEAKFTIVSASEITATVPKDATTGPVRVITPTGKLQSNVPFRVK
jgi:uncharacterized repeat protein (TIGR03803 family)